MSSAPEQDVEKHADKEALANRIQEWLLTPVGTIADKPHWGHNLGVFKFEPESPDLAIAIEMALTEKLPRDVDDIVLRGVGVEVREIDLFVITILHQFGITTSEATLT